MVKLMNIISETFAPHSGRELDFMLSGEKPAALLTELEYKQFEPYVKSHLFISEPIILAGERNWIVTQLNEKWRINAIRRIFTWKKKVKKGDETETSLSDHIPPKIVNLYHAKLGLLLGYSKEDIRDFITNRGL